MLNTGKIYLHKILRNTVCWTLRRFIYSKILRNTIRWTLWEDLFTQNTEEYCMLNTVGRFIYTKYRGKMYAWALWEDLFKQNTEEYCMLSTVGRFIYIKYLGILYVEHRRKIYLHKILGNTLCWVLWEYSFTQNTEESCMLNTVRRFIYSKYWGIYCMLNTVGRFISTKYWGILYVEHCRKIYLHKILGITSCWPLWEYL